ncbi:hypothetical protein SAMN04487962_101137 [Marinobacter segnicrescens]|uniref:Uncharacterized protein n=1 Tax=Marinobacter segnicrescens TaxID=430453 RepID=A0A1H9YFL8_9GAMM|nr:hypothetical protein SAMN04487962_101137 [Marinobacter segnicrescens]
MMEPIRYREHSFRPDNDPVWRKRGLKTFLPRRLLGLDTIDLLLLSSYRNLDLMDPFWLYRGY